jgi:hypothetical protein
MINLTSSEDIDKYQNDVTKQMMSLEQIFAKSIRPVIGRQHIDAANLVEIGTFNVNAPVNKQAEVLYSIFLNNYKRISTIFLNLTNRYILDSGKGLNSIYTKIDISKEEFLRILRLWINEQVAKKVVLVNNTTKQLIQKVIDKGLMENKTVKEIAKDIRKISEITNKTRAMTITITETHTAAVYTMDKYIINTGLVIGRRWVSAKDERTRRPPESEFDHLAANGEVVGVNEKFIKTGEPLDYPGDPNGSPGNIINCFPAGTMISGVSPLAVTRQWYEGELIEITTSNEDKLIGTLNHPIANYDGWCLFKDVKEMDYLYSVYDYKNNNSISIEKMFDSFSKCNDIERISKDNVDFHGQKPNEDIDMVKSDLKFELLDPFLRMGITDINFFDTVNRTKLNTIELVFVTKIKKFDYSGYVYNLQDKKGFYLANKVISKNCRCILLYDLKRK